VKYAVLLAVALIGGLSSTVAAPPLTQRDAKVRTFKALLHMTEERPDAIDATRSAITVGGCERRTYGFRCHGALSPVLISGIVAPICEYRVFVFKHSTRVSDTNCE